jgi:preprotein translocase subunit SecY
MQAKRRVTKLVATAAIAGGILAGSVAAAPNLYHDMGNPPTTQTLTTVASATTSGVGADLYHDM